MLTCIHGTTRKGAHAEDEKLEFFNGDYSKRPTPRTKTAFVDRSRYVGIAKKAKNTILSSTLWNGVAA